MATTLDDYAPYDSGPGSNVTEDRWRQFAQHWRGNGVIRDIGTQFIPVGDSTGMQIKVGTGECWIKGNWGQNLSVRTIPIAAAHATLGRRDLVVLRNDFVNNRIEIDVITGTPNASPVYPTVTQNSLKWEIQLGKVVVGAAVSTITAGNVAALQQFTDGSCSYTVDSGFQTVANDTVVRVDWDLELFPSSAVDLTGTTGINAFTLRRAGQWMFVASVEWASNSSGFRAAYIARTADGPGGISGNRLGFQKVPPVSGDKTVQNITAMERFVLNDEVALFVHQTSGGGLQVTKDYTSTRIHLYWLGP